MTTPTNPVTQLAGAEVSLVRGIDQATRRLEQIGTVHLDGALDRLERAAQETMARMQAGAVRYRQILDDLARAFDANTEAVREDVAASTIPLLGLPGPSAEGGGKPSPTLPLPDSVDLDWDGTTPFDEEPAEDAPVQTAACPPVEPEPEKPARGRRGKRGSR